MTWTLSVSTLISENPRIIRFLEDNRSALGNFDEVLLICQTRGKPMPAFPPDLPMNIRVIESTSTGISASRNVGIDHFRSEVIWFMDDDVKLVSNLREIKAAIEKSAAEINTLRIQDTDSDELFKAYGPGRNLSALDLLKVSSIEVTCKRSLFERTAIRFPEWIGVGTALPSGEENLFLLDAHRRCTQIRHLPLIGCRHPLLSSELKAMWTRPNRTRCMGIVARQFGPLGVLLCFRWAVRGWRAGVQTQRIIDLWKGYFRGSAGIPQGWNRLSTSRSP